MFSMNALVSSKVKETSSVRMRNLIFIKAQSWTNVYSNWIKTFNASFAYLLIFATDE